MHASRQRGFTYIGILIFLAILGVASAATLTVGSLMQRRADEAELMFIGAQYAAAFKSFYDATPVGQAQFPAKIADLLRDPRYPGIRRHLRKKYVDPITGSEEWGLVSAPGGGLMGIYSLSKLAPIKIDGFSAEFAPLAGKTAYSEWVFGFAPGIAPPQSGVAPPQAGAGAPPSSAPASTATQSHPAQEGAPPREEN